MPSLERVYHDLSRPIRAFTFTVDSLEAGKRLDTLLREHYPWHSRTRFRDKLKRGEVQVNGTPGKPSSRVRKNDVVRVEVPVDPNAPELETADDLEILFEDEHLVAVCKPSNMAAHPVGRTRHGTLINKLHARYRSDDPDADTVPRLGHRLDRDTSGVVLCVKNRDVDARVVDAFSQRQVRKTYLALVVGVPSEDDGVIEAPLGQAIDSESGLNQCVRPDGLPSTTRWRVLERFAHYALLECRPHTGRTHQIRVHLAHIGHPIVADHLYGDVRPLTRRCIDRSTPRVQDTVILNRLALHAHRLELDHPITGVPLEIESALPADLSVAVEAMRTPA